MGGKLLESLYKSLFHNSSHFLDQTILFRSILYSPLYFFCPSKILSTLPRMKSSTTLVPLLVSALFASTSFAKVRFAGVNIAGCDFGCTNAVSDPQSASRLFYSCSNDGVYRDIVAAPTAHLVKDRDRCNTLHTTMASMSFASL